MATKPSNIDEYLAAVAIGHRSALEKLRKLIQSIAPDAEEGISYGVAAFRLHGRPLVGFGATGEHCALFPMTGHTVADFAEDLRGYDTSKGAIRFTAKKPLTSEIVRKIVKARIAEVQSQAKPKSGKPKTLPAKPIKSKPTSSKRSSKRSPNSH